MFHKQEKQNVQIDYGKNLGALYEKPNPKSMSSFTSANTIKIKGKRERELTFSTRYKKP